MDTIQPHYADANTCSEMSLCCCCLELVCRKSLWSEYIWMGRTEVYGEMIEECYGISISKLHKNICEVCITQVRNAVRFKLQVLASQDKLKAMKGNVKKENEDLSDGVRDNEDLLEDCANDVKQESLNEIDSDCSDNVPLIKDRRVYENMKSEYDIPPKLRKGRRQYNYMKSRQNICLILENSTVLPFKSNKGYFTCFYCHKQHAVFEELKAHMTEHKNVTIQDSLKCLLRPHALKVDASNLACKICGQSQHSVQDLLKHLTGIHSIKFNSEAKLKPIDAILPYDLGDGKFRCYVCKKEFLFFKTLSKHMNEHSTNYICDVCGKCFILPERLRAHKHNKHVDVKTVKCEECGKVCSSKVVLKSHIRYAHKKILFVCSICNEKFISFKNRFDHLQSVHGSVPLNLNCEKCCKTFATPGSLNNHVRKEHAKVVKDAKFRCDSCAMIFKTKSALKCHSVVHSGEKNYECGVCHKKYGRSRTLNEHMKIHRNDRRWSCMACSQAFVQKCSLKNHVRVHHGDMNGDQLLLYKEPEKT